MGQSTTQISDIDQWYQEIPEKWRVQPPRDLAERIEYDRWMIKHIMGASSFSCDQKLKLIHALGVDLEKTEAKRQNEHECACCGITLRVTSLVGPECAKHPDKFPCNAHRGGKEEVTCE